MNRRAVVRAALFVGGLFAFHLATQRLVTRNEALKASVAGAPANAYRLKADLSNLGSPRDCPTVLLLGSSQTTSVASLERGKQRVEDAVGTTVDALAEKRPDLCFARLAYPAMLPLEAIVFIASYLAKAAPPRMIIFGLTWDSLAYYQYFRPDAEQLLRDRSLRDGVIADLQRVGAAPRVISELAETRATSSVAPESVKETLEASMTARAAHVLPWLANLSVQAAVTREIYEPIFGLLMHGGTTNVLEIVPEHLAFNLDATRALVAYARAHDIRVLTYRVPRRRDIPSLTRLDGEEAAMGALSRELESAGATVLDLRDSIPDEDWGWAGEAPDRTHFSLRGHAILATSLVQAPPFEALR